MRLIVCWGCLSGLTIAFMNRAALLSSIGFLVVAGTGVTRAADDFKVPETGPIGFEGDRGQMEYRRIRLKESP